MLSEGTRTHALMYLMPNKKNVSIMIDTCESGIFVTTHQLLLLTSGEKIVSTTFLLSKWSSRLTGIIVQHLLVTTKHKEGIKTRG